MRGERGTEIGIGIVTETIDGAMNGIETDLPIDAGLAVDRLVDIVGIEFVLSPCL